MEILITDINLKGNPISDRRLLKLIDQCRTKQIIDYVKQHCPKTSTPKDSEAAKGKNRKKKQSSEEEEENINVEYQYSITVKPSLPDFKVNNILKSFF